MTAQEAKEMWQRVAQGDRDPIVDAWLRELAAKIVAEVFDARYSSERASKALVVVGFRGKQGRPSKYHTLESTVAALPGMSAREVAEIAKLVDDIPSGTPTPRLQKSVEAIRAKSRQK